MAKKPNVLCAGTCGKLLWGGGTSLPCGLRMCRACRATAAPAKTNANCSSCGGTFLSVRKSNGHRTKYCSRACAGNGLIGQDRRRCTQPGCDKRHDARGLCKDHYQKLYDPERRKARQRARTHRRRNAGRYGDVTLTYEQALRANAKRCPLCDVKLIEEPYLPASKELDQLTPLGAGGTHTIGNVRIVCRACNQGRPYDGSDYVGQLTLWAEQPGFMPAVPPKARASRCAHGMPSYYRCNQCTPPKLRPKPVVVQHADVFCLDCGVGLPRTGMQGRPRKRCLSCAPVTLGDARGSYSA